MESYTDRMKRDSLAEDELPPQVQKVTKTLVTNTIDAMASMTVISSSTDQMTWIGNSGRERRPYVALQNGILDLEKALADNEDDDESTCMVPHSPDWFSSICLPYSFDLHAECPRWEAFLEKNLEMDPERIKVLQEWAGYLLLPDTGEQKFLVLEGEGSNGKSVYCAAMTAMLGADNCSHIPLELFADRFAKTQTLGKLVNISADVGELDKVAEGYLKSFTSGDVMYFDRKGVPGVDCTPTARLMLACNNRPRFSDRSSGVWRRMLLIPWRIEITRAERIRNMDKPWWWEQSGELPGIFNWALLGLHRLRQQTGFSDSSLSTEALEDYRLESNPARAFLKEHLEECNSELTDNPKGIRSQYLYRLYKAWAENGNYRPLGERVFGKEVKRTFPTCGHHRGGVRSDRYWFYQNIKFISEEICGERTCDGNLF
jgi:putative DNA primase/helicase